MIGNGGFNRVRDAEIQTRCNQKDVLAAVSLLRSARSAKEVRELQVPSCDWSSLSV